MLTIKHIRTYGSLNLINKRIALCKFFFWDYSHTIPCFALNNPVVD